MFSLGDSSKKEQLDLTYRNGVVFGKDSFMHIGEGIIKSILAAFQPVATAELSLKVVRNQVLGK